MPLWTPDRLGSLCGWWDPNDNSTVTDVGGACSQLDDKSANGNDLVQSVAGTRPLITPGGINGFQSLECVSTDYLEKLGISGFPDTATGIGFGVIIFPSALANRAIWDISDTTATNRTALIVQNVGGSAYLLREGTSNASTISYSDVSAPHMVSGSVSTVLRDGYIDGAQGTTNSTSLGNIVSTNLRYGCLHQNANPYIGQLGELIFFTGVAAADRQIVEGYLAWKWGVQANLPSSHPYFGAAPSIGYTPVGGGGPAMDYAITGQRHMVME